MAAKTTSAKKQRRPVAARGDGHRLRSDIIAATEELVEELDDPWSISLRSVARKVGIAPTSIYLHFDSLEELLVAVKGSLWSSFGEFMVRAAANTGSSPFERIRAFGDGYLAFARSRPGAYRTMFTTPWDLPVPDGNYMGHPQFGLVVQAIEDAGHDADEAAMRAVHLWCAMHGLVMLRSPLSKFPWPSESDQLDHLARLAIQPLDALLAPESDAALRD